MKYLLFLLTCLNFGRLSAQSNIKVGEKAPEIHITDWIANVPADKNLNHKFIVLEFWATWCGPCIAAVPHMNDLQKQFNQNDLYFISITDESVAKVERSLKRIDFQSIVVSDQTKQTHINFGDGKEGLEAYPLTVLIDKNGVIKWIGEPKSLTGELMKTFLSGPTVGQSEQKAGQIKKVEVYDFKRLVSNKDITYYFDVNEASTDNKLKIAMGTSLINLTAYTLKDVYSEFLQIGNENLVLPERLASVRYDILYKNMDEPENIGRLEKELLQKLALTRKSSTKTSSINLVAIQDAKLLEPALDESFSAKSDAGDKTLFTAYTLDEMMKALSDLANTTFKFSGDNDGKYDFIIENKSMADIVSSLESYGLSVQTVKREVETVHLVEVQ
ncbi:TlpA disulfide reductase family protein [uncultured Imperialibacter sp.]|uniref:TlpA family protein disulfide reductase n=1 Tax=uncultured Imperialibacter sp. TaxID=1672639 RepID=UPI0030D72C0C|tara:strand:- start:25181 stop:26341 length:1161 start_codon:yes stop_codon:yes gene_type:complete